MYMSFREIHSEYKKPLEYKIEKAKAAIESAYKVCQSRASIAFSGGKDSTVLWHLIKTYFPKESEKTAVIFGNTGVEYPESLKFARELGQEWGGNNFYEAMPDKIKKDSLKYAAQVRLLNYFIKNGEIVKHLKADGKLKNTDSFEKACPPDLWKIFEEERLIWKAGTPKSYWYCLDQYGFPILGKSASKLKARRINIDCFLQFSKTSSGDEELKRYYEMLRSVKISQACCDVLKKEPSKKLQRELKVDVCFLGMMASESLRRKRIFAQKGYLFEVVTESRRIKMPAYQCHPLAIWTDEDIWEYIKTYNVPYSPLYDITYKDEDGNTCKMKRNGCVGCYTDYGRKNSHMYILRQTHPKKWKSVMQRGMAAEIQKLRTLGGAKFRPSKKNYHRLAILDTYTDLSDKDYAEGIDWAVENRPCAFD